MRSIKLGYWILNYSVEEKISHIGGKHRARTGINIEIIIPSTIFTKTAPGAIRASSRRRKNLEFRKGLHYVWVVKNPPYLEQSVWVHGTLAGGNDVMVLALLGYNLKNWQAEEGTARRMRQFDNQRRRAATKNSRRYSTTKVYIFFSSNYTREDPVSTRD